MWARLSPPAAGDSMRKLAVAVVVVPAIIGLPAAVTSFVACGCDCWMPAVVTRD
jgi:hypothetical protein